MDQDGVRKAFLSYLSVVISADSAAATTAVVALDGISKVRPDDIGSELASYP